MKLIALFCLVTFLSLQAEEGLAPGVLYPKAGGEWTPVPAREGTERQTRAEITPGHHYILSRPARDKSGVTAVYHTTTPDSFDPANAKVNVNALHLVAEFPVKEAGFVKTEANGKTQWSIVGKRPKSEAAQALSIEWIPLPECPPVQPAKNQVRVALFDDYGSFGKGVPRCTELLKDVSGVSVTAVKPALIREGGLRDFDVVIFTGGSGGKQAGTLGLSGREQVRRFIQAGGGYVGICAGNYLACEGFSWGLHVLDAKTKSSKWARGVGDVKIEFTPRGREILKMPAGLLDIRYANGPVFDAAANAGVPDFETLAVFRSELAENGAPAGIQTGSPAMVAGVYGKGRVLCSSPHPEQQAGMETFIAHAVKWTAGQDP